MSVVGGHPILLGKVFKWPTLARNVKIENYSMLEGIFPADHKTQASEGNTQQQDKKDLEGSGLRDFLEDKFKPSGHDSDDSFTSATQNQALKVIPIRNKTYEDGSADLIENYNKDDPAETKYKNKGIIHQDISKVLAYDKNNQNTWKLIRKNEAVESNSFQDKNNDDEDFEGSGSGLADIVVKEKDTAVEYDDEYFQGSGHHNGIFFGKYTTDKEDDYELIFIPKVTPVAPIFHEYGLEGDINIKKEKNEPEGNNSYPQMEIIHY